MNMEYVSSTVGPIPRTVSESALPPVIMEVWRDVEFAVARFDEEGQSQVRDPPA